MMEITPVRAGDVVRVILLAGLLLKLVVVAGVIAQGFEIEQGLAVGLAFIQKKIIRADPL